MAIYKGSILLGGGIPTFQIQLLSQHLDLSVRAMVGYA